MKTDNQLIMVAEAAHQKYSESGFKKGFELVYSNGAVFGANWQKEQLQPLLDSHKEILNALKDAHRLLLTNGSTDWWVKHKEDCAKIYDTIHKANNINH